MHSHPDTHTHCSRPTQLSIVFTGSQTARPPWATSDQQNTFIHSLHPTSPPFLNTAVTHTHTHTHTHTQTQKQTHRHTYTQTRTNSLTHAKHTQTHTHTDTHRHRH